MTYYSRMQSGEIYNPSEGWVIAVSPGKLVSAARITYGADGKPQRAEETIYRSDDRETDDRLPIPDRVLLLPYYNYLLVVSCTFEGSFGNPVGGRREILVGLIADDKLEGVISPRDSEEYPNVDPNRVVGLSGPLISFPDTAGSCDIQPLSISAGDAEIAIIPDRAAEILTRDILGLG